MEAGYFKTCWGDIKETPGWFAKILLLGLLFMIPVFGQIVVFGYAYGWAREIAWNMKTPLPARIFANEDGRLYSRGFFVLVIAFVCALIPNIFESAWDAMAGRGLDTASDMVLGAGMHGVLPDMMMTLLFLALSIITSLFAQVGSMRSTVYCRLAPGFQVTRVWAMMRHDSRGVGRIFLMSVVMAIAIYAVFMLIVTAVGMIFGGAALAVLATGPDPLSAISSMDPMLIAMAIFAICVFAAVFSYIFSCLFVFALLVEVRAWGYWTRQFDVPAWGGQDDPMPFERHGNARG